MIQYKLPIKKENAAEDTEQQMKKAVNGEVVIVAVFLVLATIASVYFQRSPMRIFLFFLLNLAISLVLVLSGYGLEKFRVLRLQRWAEEKSTLVATLKVFFSYILAIIGALVWLAILTGFVGLQFYMAWHARTEIRIDSLSTYSAMPTELLTIRGAGLAAEPSDRYIIVRFFDDAGYDVVVLVPGSEKSVAKVSVPLYIDPKTGAIRSGMVNVQVIRYSSKYENASNIVQGFEIQDLPALDWPAGTITLEYITKLSEAIDSTIKKIDTVNSQVKFSTSDLRNVLKKQKSLMTTMKSQVSGIMQDPAKSYALGEFRGLALNLDKDSLAVSDRLIAAYVSQMSNSGQTGNEALLSGTDMISHGMRTGLRMLAESEIATMVSAYDAPELVVSNQVDRMITSIGEGIKANSESMKSLGGNMMATATFIALFPGGQAPAIALASLGATMYFTGLTAHTGIIAAIHTSVDGLIRKDPQFTQTRNDVNEYVGEVFFNGIGAAATTLPPERINVPASLMIDSVSLVKSGMDALGNFNKNAQESLGQGRPDDTSDQAPAQTQGDTASQEKPGYNLLMVGVEGEGAITSDPAGITCRGDCTEYYPENSLVTLYTYPNAGYEFTGWRGACSGKGDCTVKMLKDWSIIGTFTKKACPAGAVMCGSSCCGPGYTCCNTKCTIGTWDCDSIAGI
jgi:hypothetical protein